MHKSYNGFSGVNMYLIDKDGEKHTVQAISYTITEPKPVYYVGTETITFSGKKSLDGKLMMYEPFIPVHSNPHYTLCIEARDEEGKEISMSIKDITICSPIVETEQYTEFSFYGSPDNVTEWTYDKKLIT